MNDNGNLPALRMVCTGLIQQMTERLPKAQRQYALEMGRTGFCLCAHPLYNQWSLINKPVAGTKANCVVRVQDVHITVPLSWLNTITTTTSWAVWLVKGIVSERPRLQLTRS